MQKKIQNFGRFEPLTIALPSVRGQRKITSKMQKLWAELSFFGH